MSAFTLDMLVSGPPLAETELPADSTLGVAICQRSREQHSREQRLLDLLVGNPTLKAGIKGGVMNMEVAVSEKGQVTVPTPIREQLGLRPGSAVEFSAAEGRLVGIKGGQLKIRCWLSQGLSNPLMSIGISLKPGVPPSHHRVDTSVLLDVFRPRPTT